MNKRVFTELGQGEVVATFTDGTVCVRLDSGGGAVLLPHQIFAVPEKRSRRESRQVYSKAG